MKTIKIFLLAMLVYNTAYALDLETIALSQTDQNLGETENSSISSISGNSLQLSAGADKGTASLKLGSSFFKNNMSLLLSVPLDKGGSDKDFNDSNELVKNTSAKLNFQFSLAGKNRDIDPVKWVPLVEYCESSPSEFGYEKLDDCNGKRLDDLIKDFKGNTRALSDITSQIDLALKEPIHLVGFTSTLAQKNFEYFTADTTTEKKTKYTGAGSLYYSYVKPSQLGITIEYEYQSSHKAGDTETRCPAGGSGFVTCKEARNSAPQSTIKRVSSVELRQPFNILSYPVAISPKVSYDNNDSLFEAKIPFLFFQDTKNNLTGGVRADWANDDHDWDFSVFVGSKFDVF
ncbi:MAG: hypothetical protein C9356_09280 [Oleiphilus sp.]|nr:MAG: hypothetical protein C9356_09280 [Oleiphilus sp.]